MSNVPSVWFVRCGAVPGDRDRWHAGHGPLNTATHPPENKAGQRVGVTRELTIREVSGYSRYSEKASDPRKRTRGQVTYSLKGCDLELVLEASAEEVVDPKRRDWSRLTYPVGFPRMMKDKP